MWKWLKKRWWLCLIIGAAILVIGWQERRCQAHAEQCRAYYTAQESRRLGFSANSDAAEQQAINATCEPNGYLCRLFSAANLPTWLLVFVGIGGIWAALRTLNTIERQADITERQTKATEESVKALIASERAWLTASLMRDATKKDGQWYWSDRPDVLLTTEEIAKGLQYGYKLRVTNIGKTPAQILGYEQCYSCLGKDGVVAGSRSSSYVIGSENQERTMKTGDSADIFTLKIDVPMHLHLKKIDTLEETAIFYGWVKYRPIIDQSEDCFADFCYAWKPSLEVLYRRDDCNPEKHDKN